MYKTEMNSTQSLYELDELVNFCQPRYVAIKLSEQDYSKNYEAYARSAAFRTDMKKLDFLIKTKNEEEIKNFRGWNMKDLHNFYLFNYCTYKKCQVIFGDLDDEKLTKKELAKSKLKEIKQEMSSNLKN